MPLLTTCSGACPKSPSVLRLAWMHENAEVAEVEAARAV